MKIYIKQNTIYYNPIFYTLRIIEKNKKIEFDFVDEIEKADIFWDYDMLNSQPISINFYNNLNENDSNLAQSNIFKNKPIIYDEKGNEDYIATIFYMINCLQEFCISVNDTDNFERFKYSSSYQYRFNNIKENLVQQFINKLIEKWALNGVDTPSCFYISHDIDSIYGALKQEGLWALRNKNISKLLYLILLEIIRKPLWKNIDKIIKLNSSYDICSTFFWLVNNGIGERGAFNADYFIEKEQNLIKKVENSNFYNGLHKSCSKIGITDEFNKVKLNSSSNRYHYLKFLPKNDWGKLSESQIELDASLGFAEIYGFRNSYGNAFQPYNIIEKKAYNFISTPLVFMDATLDKYMKIEIDKISKTVIEFFENNNNNCIISLLWHNTYLTDFQFEPFLKEYKKIILYIYENKIKSISPNEIIEKNKLNW